MGSGVSISCSSDGLCSSDGDGLGFFFFFN